jgi:hypothetical protein
MIMILRYIALTTDYDCAFDWGSAYKGEFATQADAEEAAKKAVIQQNDDFWQVVDLMTKKMVSEGTYKDEIRAAKRKELDSRT